MIGMVKRVAVKAAKWSRDQWVDVGREGALGDAWVDRELRSVPEADAAPAYNGRVIRALEEQLVNETNSKRAAQLAEDIKHLRARGDALEARRVAAERAAAPALQASAARIAGEHAAIMASGGYATGRSPEECRAHAEQGRACREAILKGVVSEGPRDDSPAAVLRDLVQGLFHKPPVADCVPMEQKTLN